MDTVLKYSTRNKYTVLVLLVCTVQYSICSAESPILLYYTVYADPVCCSYRMIELFTAIERVHVPQHSSATDSAPASPLSRRVCVYDIVKLYPMLTPSGVASAYARLHHLITKGIRLEIAYSRFTFPYY